MNISLNLLISQIVFRVMSVTALISEKLLRWSVKDLLLGKTLREEKEEKASHCF